MAPYSVLLVSGNSAKINLNKRIIFTAIFPFDDSGIFDLMKLSKTTLNIIYVLIAIIIIITMIIAFIPGLRWSEKIMI